MPNKLLIYSLNFAPELTGIGKYNGEMAEWLARQGYEVRVISAPPYYPAWKVAEGYSSYAYRKENWKGIEVYRCPVWVPGRVTGLKRLFHLASFALSSLPVLFRQMWWRPDVCVVIEPPLAISPFAVLFTRLFGVKAWLHVQDFEADAAFELGILPDKPKLKKAVLGMEKRLMKRFSVVSSISEPMVAKLRAKGVPEERIRLFPNWVDTSQVFPLPARNSSFREPFGLRSDDFVALYSGNMGEKQGLELVLDAAELLKPFDAIRFVLCGEGSAKARLMREAEARGLDNVLFLPLQPVEKLNELLNMADLHLLVQKSHASDLVMPSKLTGMLASGRPIVATAAENSAVHRVMNESQSGIVVPPEEPVPLADAVLKLFWAGNDCATFGRNGRQFAVEHLGMDSILGRFMQNVQTLKDPKGRRELRTQELEAVPGGLPDSRPRE